MVSYKGWATDLVDDCFDSFVDLQPLFYKERGSHFMYKEGNICIAVIKASLEQNMPVLTLHDSFICKQRDKDVVEQIVKSAFEKEVMVSCVVE